MPIEISELLSRCQGTLRTTRNRTIRPLFVNTTGSLCFRRPKHHQKMAHILPAPLFLQAPVVELTAPGQPSSPSRYASRASNTRIMPLCMGVVKLAQQNRRKMRLEIWNRTKIRCFQAQGRFMYNRPRVIFLQVLQAHPTSDLIE